MLRFFFILVCVVVGIPSLTLPPSSRGRLSSAIAAPRSRGLVGFLSAPIRRCRVFFLFRAAVPREDPGCPRSRSLSPPVSPAVSPSSIGVSFRAREVIDSGPIEDQSGVGLCWSGLIYGPRSDRRGTAAKYHTSRRKRVGHP